MPVLTLDEVALFLRTDPTNVRDLLSNGDLAGFKVAGEWRILRVALIDYLRREMAATQEAGLYRTLDDPHAWARELRREPEFAAQLMEQTFSDGSMGAFLQEALRTEEQERTAGNVYRLNPDPPQ
jgi:hypothetical protein